MIARLAPQAGRLQMATGAVMVIVALLMAGNYDTRFQTAIANDLPAVLVNPTKDLEENGDVSEQLARLRTVHQRRRHPRRRRRESRTAASCRSSARRLNSPTPSSGSTPPATGR